MNEICVLENNSDEAQNNEISEVVVFADQAHVKRHIKAKAHPGFNRFLIDVQAFSVDPESAHANVFGEGEILGVQYKKLPAEEAPQEDVRILDERKRELQRDRKSLDHRREVIEKKRRFLDSIISFSEHEMPKHIQTRFPEMERLQEMMDFLQSSYQGIAEGLEAFDNEIEDLDYELAVLERQLEVLNRPREYVRKTIEVLFDSSKEQTVHIEASYVARGASWEPLYRVDASTDLSTVNMTMFAHIKQNTGEDWSKVRLTLSNAIATKASKLPDLRSWYLRQPVIHGRSHAMLAASVAEAMDADSKETTVLGEKEEMHTDVASTTTNAEEFMGAEKRELPSSFENTLPQRVDIASGGEETLLPLHTKHLQADFSHYAVPRIDPLTYLVCQAEADRALLAGRLNVHFGGRFVGSTKLMEKRPGEHMRLNLGGVRGVTARREKITDKRSETFFGMVDRQSVARELEFRIVVENLKNDSTRVHIIDAVPVSTTDRFQVKGLELTPEPTQKDWNEKEGVMFWELELKPRSVREIRIRCYVKHPKEILPQGL